MIKLLNERDLQQIHRVNIVDFILEGVKVLEQDFKLNYLNKDITRASETPEIKIKINNLIRLLDLLVTECEHDPLTGRILIEAELLLSVLKRLRGTLIGGTSPGWLLGKTKKDSSTVNDQLDKIIIYLELWEKNMKSKFSLPLGNAHTVDTYHPRFYATYKFKPSYLPEDYRSNFFFEVRIKELCPFTTTILFHPYAEFQRSFQEERSIETLSRVNLNVDLRDESSIELSDNIRGFRVNGPRDDKKYPGSYIVIRGGHHRTRAIFKKYVKGEVDGGLKLLFQLVDPRDFPDKSLMSWVWAEIALREEIRKKFQ